LPVEDPVFAGHSCDIESTTITGYFASSAAWWRPRARPAETGFEVAMIEAEGVGVMLRAARFRVEITAKGWRSPAILGQAEGR
jgi:hypothetical protein